MLFIVYGATLEVGYESRCIFEKNGFDIIIKYNYVADDSLVDKQNYLSQAETSSYFKWYNDKKFVGKEQIAKCDFQYDLDGVFVGFDKEQIMDAVRGVTDAVVTVGASSIDLLVQLKKAFGEYVTTINVFEEQNSVIESIYNSDEISFDEKEVRVNANKKMQRLYLENKKVFDEIVIYSRLNDIYGLASLEYQYVEIIKKRKTIEKALNDKKYIELPYSGKEPYAFISYSHGDINRVYPVLAILQRNSYRIWYDEGIVGGDNWRKILAEKIKGASAFLLFSSAMSTKSENVEAEITAALDCKIPIITVMLDDSCFDLGYKMYLDSKQKIDANTTDFETKLMQALPSSIQQ